MKIKRKEYEKRIEEAFESGLRIGIDNPSYAKMYLANDKVKSTLRELGKSISRAFENIGVNVHSDENDR